MQYFGVPRCPYCNKRVNLVRTWSLKKQGEYRCPRCKGISNIFLSPLIYVAAVIAIFIAVAIFFFHQFVMDDMEPMIAVQLVIPFAAFFFISLFMVYLKKPVINKVNKKNLKGRKKATQGKIPTQNARRTPMPGERIERTQPSQAAAQRQTAQQRLFREGEAPRAPARRPQGAQQGAPQGAQRRPAQQGSAQRSPQPQAGQNPAEQRQRPPAQRPPQSRENPQGNNPSGGENGGRYRD